MLDQLASLVRWFIDFVLHLDAHLTELTQRFGTGMYVILFLIVFCETGLVVTPFLPGDSLLFALGALCALPDSALDPVASALLLIVAAILGDTVNYSIGLRLGPRAYEAGRFRFIKKEHLDYTHAFYSKHGGKTIVLARFMPIVRTFAPFVAGVGRMEYRQFIAYNVGGAIAWVSSFVALGYWFGNMPIVKKNFTLVILAIIVLSVLPAAFEFLRHRRTVARNP